LIEALNLISYGNDQPESGHFISSKTIDKFFEDGYSEVYGVCSFKRLIGNKIENPISMKVLAGDFKLVDQINVTLKNGKYNLSSKKRTRPPSMTALMLGK
jgi:ATP-dependent Clp protease ATP-binding subunit ClpA